jgi:imidazolonepropionase-like amidohydrolase
MIDCHVHLVMDGSPDPTAPLMSMDDATAAILMMIHARQTLNAGFTTVRDLGCLNHVGLRVRDAINQGRIKGPRILCAGQMICMTGGHGWQIGREADGPDEVCKAVRAQIKAGVDVIKLMATGGICTRGVEPGQTQYSIEEMRAGVIEAHKAGIPAAAHAQGLEGVKIALQAGIDTIEHGMNLDDEAIGMMCKNQVPLIPTLAAGACIIRHGRPSGIPSFIVEKSERHREERIHSCIRACRAGVAIALGTDAGTPFNLHGNNAAELSELAVTGMAPHDIVLAATGNAAKAIGISHLTGTLAPGMQADFLILKHNPLENIQVLLDRQAIVEIQLGGKRVNRDEGFDT